jgi:hypothetical protein
MNDNIQSSEMTARYLLMELMKMGYRLESNRSAKSADSWYIKICVGTRERPKAVHLRISDHAVPPRYWATVRYDFDICGSRLRKNAITCVDFFTIFAFQYGKPLPQEVANFMPGTPGYETYVSSLRQKKTA